MVDYLLDRIAIGGMAEVYRAVTQGVEGFRRTFVVKRILSDKASSPTFIRMFCDEARISALLHHPNVVQVYDFGHVSGSYFLAMEYLPGKDLSSLMRVLRAAKAAVPPGRNWPVTSSTAPVWLPSCLATIAAPPTRIQRPSTSASATSARVRRSAPGGENSSS